MSGFVGTMTANSKPRKILLREWVLPGRSRQRLSFALVSAGFSISLGLGWLGTFPLSGAATVESFNRCIFREGFTDRQVWFRALHLPADFRVPAFQIV